jgi:hypothetical protein
MNALLRQQAYRLLCSFGQVLLLTLLVSVGLSSSSSAQVEPNVYRVPTDPSQTFPLTLGSGFTTNDIYSLKAPTLTNFVPSRDGTWKNINPNAAQGAEIKIYRATSREEILDTLGWSASVAAHYMAWNANAQLRYSNRQLRTSSSITFVINARVNWGIYGIANPEALINSTAVAAYHGNFLSFAKRYGERMVTDVSMGQSLSIVLQLRNVEDETYEQLNASAGGGYSGLLTGVDFKATLEKAMRRANEQSDLTINVHTTGGDPTTLSSFILTNISSGNLVDSLTVAIQNYITANFTRERSVPLAYHTTAFEALIPPAPNDAAQDFYNAERDTFLAELTSLYYDLRETRAEIDTLLSGVDGVSVVLTSEQRKTLLSQRKLYETYSTSLLLKHLAVKSQMVPLPTTWVIPVPPRGYLTFDEMYALNVFPSPMVTSYNISEIPPFDNPAGVWTLGFFVYPHPLDPDYQNVPIHWRLYNELVEPGKWRLYGYQPLFYTKTQPDHLILSNGPDGPSSSAVVWKAPAKGRWKITYQVRGLYDNHPTLTDTGSVLHLLRETTKTITVNSTPTVITIPALLSESAVPRDDFGIWSSPVTLYVRMKRNEPLYFRHLTNRSANYSNSLSEVRLKATIQWAPLPP